MDRCDQVNGDARAVSIGDDRGLEDPAIVVIRNKAKELGGWLGGLGTGQGGDANRGAQD
jgi:hypothetical protein